MCAAAAAAAAAAAVLIFVALSRIAHGAHMGIQVDTYHIQQRRVEAHLEREKKEMEYEVAGARSTFFFTFVFTLLYTILPALFLTLLLTLLLSGSVGYGWS